jgi:hypothetical protein
MLSRLSDSIAEANQVHRSRIDAFLERDDVKWLCAGAETKVVVSNHRTQCSLPIKIYSTSKQTDCYNFEQSKNDFVLLVCHDLRTSLAAEDAWLSQLAVMLKVDVFSFDIHHFGALASSNKEHNRNNNNNDFDDDENKCQSESERDDALRWKNAYGDGPNESRMMKDSKFVLDYLVHRCSVPLQRIVVFGSALGSTLALHLCLSVAAKKMPPKRATSTSALLLPSWLSSRGSGSAADDDAGAADDGAAGSRARRGSGFFKVLAPFKVGGHSSSSSSSSSSSPASSSTGAAAQTLSVPPTKKRRSRSRSRGRKADRQTVASLDQADIDAAAAASDERGRSQHAVVRNDADFPPSGADEQHGKQANGPRGIGGLVLESPHRSLRAVFSGGSMFHDALNNAKLIETLDCPLLIVHAATDEQVPAAHSKALLKKAERAEVFERVLVECDRAALYSNEYVDELLEPVMRFIAHLGVRNGLVADDATTQRSSGSGGAPKLPGAYDEPSIVAWLADIGFADRSLADKFIAFGYSDVEFFDASIDDSLLVAMGITDQQCRASIVAAIKGGQVDDVDDAKEHSNEPSIGGWISTSPRASIGSARTDESFVHIESLRAEINAAQVEHASELARIEQQLILEREKVSEVEQQLMKEKEQRNEVEQQLMKEKEQQNEVEQQLMKEKEQRNEVEQQLMKEKEQRNEVEQQLMKEKEQRNEVEQQLMKEKEQRNEVEQQLMKEKEQRNEVEQQLMKEKEQQNEVEQQLMKEKEQRNEVEQQLMKEKEQRNEVEQQLMKEKEQRNEVEQQLMKEKGNVAQVERESEQHLAALHAEMGDTDRDRVVLERRHQEVLNALRNEFENEKTSLGSSEQGLRDELTSAKQETIELRKCNDERLDQLRAEHQEAIALHATLESKIRSVNIRWLVAFVSMFVLALAFVATRPFDR